MSGTGYDRWSYEQSSMRGAGTNDTTLNKIQRKYWVARTKVERKFGKDQDEHIAASGMATKIFASVGLKVRVLNFFRR